VGHAGADADAGDIGEDNKTLLPGTASLETDTATAPESTVSESDGIPDQSTTGSVRERDEVPDPEATRSIAMRDIHGKLRQAERDVMVSEVWERGAMYFQSDEQVAKALSNGDGTYAVVIRDMSNPSGEPTSQIDRMTEAEILDKLESGRWH
jgi:hypothetical protein